MSKWNDYTRSLVAGVPQKIQISGDYVRVQKASAPLFMSFDGSQGIERSQTKGDPFDYEYFVELFSEVDQTVTVSLGYAVTAPPMDGRATITGDVEATIEPTAIVNDFEDVEIAAGATVEVAAFNVDRRELVIGIGDDAAGGVRAGAAPTATKGVRVGIGSSAVLTSKASISVHNPNADPVTVSVSELTI